MVLPLVLSTVCCLRDVAGSHLLARVAMIWPIQVKQSPVLCWLVLATTNQICQPPSWGSLALSYMHHISVMSTCQGKTYMMDNTCHAIRKSSKGGVWSPGCCPPSTVIKGYLKYIFSPHLRLIILLCEMRW